MSFSVDANTVALWPLDTVNTLPTNVIVDSVGSLDLTCTGTFHPCILNGPKEDGTDWSRGFVGRSKYTRAGDAASSALFNGTNGEFTIEAWVWFKTGGTTIILSYDGTVGDGNATQNNLTSFRVLSTGYLYSFWEYALGTNDEFTQTAGTPLTSGVWSHVAMTVADVAGVRTVRFLINGVLQETYVGTTANDGSNSDWYFGGTISDYTYATRIAHVHVSDVVRSDAYLAANTAAKGVTPDVNSFAYWSCQEEPPQFLDVSPSGYHVYTSLQTEAYVQDTIVGGLANSAALGNSDSLVLVSNVDTDLVKLFPDSIGIWLASDTSVEFWIQTPLDTITDVNLFDVSGAGEGSADNYVMRVIYQANRTINIFLEYGGGTNISYNTPVLFPVDKSHDNRNYIAITRELGVGSDTWKFYVNGVLADTAVIQQPTGGADSTFYLHRSGPCHLGDCRISDIVRTPTEIANAYTAGLLGSGGTPPDATAPTVTLVSPAVDGTPIDAATPIVFDVRDETSLAHVEVRVEQVENYGTAAAKTIVETVYDGTTMVGQYTASSIAVLGAANFRFTVLRAGGWISPPSFSVTPVDEAGNKA